MSERERERERESECERERLGERESERERAVPTRRSSDLRELEREIEIAATIVADWDPR